MKVVASRPAKGATCSTPGVVRMMSIAFLTDSFGAIQRRARGQLHDGNEIALVLLRNEPGRRPGKLDAGDTDQHRISQ